MVLFLKKKVNKNISQEKLFICKILPLTWHVINMQQNSLAEYSYDWYLYSCEIFEISIFYFPNEMEFSVLKSYYSLANQHIKIM